MGVQPPRRRSSRRAGYPSGAARRRGPADTGRRRRLVRPRGRGSSQRATGSPQSQLSDRNTSPVTHWSCTRTSTGSGVEMSPSTKAMCSRVSMSVRYPTAVKSPKLLGRPALGDALDERVGAEAVGDHVVDGDDLDVVLAGERDEIRGARDRAVLAQHLADDRGGRAAGKTGHVHGRLGVAGAHPAPRRLARAAGRCAPAASAARAWTRGRPAPGSCAHGRRPTRRWRRRRAPRRRR